MGVTRGTLAKNIDGLVEYIYPKTEADLVEYDKENSVKDKIKSIDKIIDNLNAFEIKEDGSAELDIQGSSDNSIIIKRTLDSEILQVNEKIDSIELTPGPQGEQGIQGETGKDGFSPIIEVNELENGHTVSITDNTSTKTFNVLNGENGAQGPKGEKGDTGEQGIQGEKGDTGTSVTHSYNNGVLDVTSASGTTSINLNNFVNAAFSDIFFVGSEDEFNAKYGSVAEAPDGLVWIRPY